MHILYLTHHSWPFPNRVMAFNFGICLAAKSAADRTWCIQQSWNLREQNKGKWLGKAHIGNKGTKLFTLEETIATSQKQICKPINFSLITVRRLRDHVPVTNYFKCHPFIIPSSHRQCVPESPDSHHVHSTTSCKNQIIYLSSSHPPEQWFLQIQGSCIATSFFHQPVIFKRYPLLLFRPKCLWRDLCWVLSTLVSLTLSVNIVFSSL